MFASLQIVRVSVIEYGLLAIAALSWRQHICRYWLWGNIRDSGTCQKAICHYIFSSRRSRAAIPGLQLANALR